MSLKKWLLLICFSLGACFMPAASEAADTSNVLPAPSIALYTPTQQFDQINSRMDTPPLLVDGHIYMPLRSYGSFFPDAAIDWHGEDQLASISRENVTFFSPVADSRFLLSDGQVNMKALKKLGKTGQIKAAPGLLIGSRTYVPLRTLVEALDGNVSYDPNTHTAAIRLKEDVHEEFHNQTPIEQLRTFAAKSAPAVLSPEKNDVYSPASLYMALSMVGMGSNGETFNEFMNVLGTPNSAALVRQAKTMMNINHQSQEGTILTANSLWAMPDSGIKKDFERTLEKDFSAQTFEVNLNSEDGARQINQWIDKNTNGLIQAEITPSDDILKLVNTVYFKAPWASPFSPDKNQQLAFTDANGSTYNVTAMTQTLMGDYLETDLYKTAGLGFKDGSRLTIILPQPGHTTDEVVPQLEKIMNLNVQEEARVEWSIPRFKLNETYDMINPLKAMGLKSVFSPQSANLNGIGENLYVSSVDQLNALTIDETGGEAASATVIGISRTAAPPPAKEVQMRLDRPFLFVLSSPDGQPLFVGRINTLKDGSAL